jgi:hypothetical protein
VAARPLPLGAIRSSSQAGAVAKLLALSTDQQ